jgi:hypothetical protein
MDEGVIETSLLNCCRSGDEDRALELLVALPELPSDDVLELACAYGLRRVVRAYINDARFEPTEELGTVAFIRAGRNGRVDIMRDLMDSNIPLREDLVYKDALMPGHHDMFNVLVERGKYACPAAFAFVLYHKLDIALFEVLLAKPTVDMTLGYLCRLCRVGDVEALRRILAAPWLDISKAALAHLVHVAEKGIYPGAVHVVCPGMVELLKQRPTYVNDHTHWSNPTECDHQKKVFCHNAVNPRVLAVIWCMHQMTAWSDMVEPTSVRMRHQVDVVLRTDSEGPLLGIPGAPAVAGFVDVPIALGILSVALIAMALFASGSRGVHYWVNMTGRMACVAIGSCTLAYLVRPQWFPKRKQD